MEGNKHKYSNFTDEEIVLTEYSEIPIVNKERRVVEEISIRKSVATKGESVYTTVKITKVNVEKFEES